MKKDDMFLFLKYIIACSLMMFLFVYFMVFCFSSSIMEPYFWIHPVGLSLVLSIYISISIFMFLSSSRTDGGVLTISELFLISRKMKNNHVFLNDLLTKNNMFKAAKGKKWNIPVIWNYAFNDDDDNISEKRQLLKNSDPVLAKKNRMKLSPLSTMQNIRIYRNKTAKYFSFIGISIPKFISILMTLYVAQYITELTDEKEVISVSYHLYWEQLYFDTNMIYLYSVSLYLFCVGVLSSYEIYSRIDGEKYIPKWYYTIALGSFVSSLTSLFYIFGASVLLESYKKTLDMQEKIVRIASDELNLSGMDANIFFNKSFSVDIETFSRNALDMEIMTMITWLLISFFVFTFHKYILIKH